jgi:4-amino-4-deoxy-L-arabinose transferase-like glycosyltransferase
LIRFTEETDVTRRMRITLKILIAYLLACIPYFLLTFVSFGHGGPIMSLGFGFAALFALRFPWAAIGRVFLGEYDFLIGVIPFLLFFAIGLFCVWITERKRKSAPARIETKPVLVQHPSCSQCSAEISFDAAVCSKCGFRFGSA